MLIGSKKYEKVKEKIHEQYTHYCVLFCNLTNKANYDDGAGKNVEQPLLNKKDLWRSHCACTADQLRQ
jgi:hypothetical protein